MDQTGCALSLYNRPGQSTAAPVPAHRDRRQICNRQLSAARGRLCTFSCIAGMVALATLRRRVTSRRSTPVSAERANKKYRPHYRGAYRSKLPTLLVSEDVFIRFALLVFRL